MTHYPTIKQRKARQWWSLSEHPCTRDMATFDLNNTTDLDALFAKMNATAIACAALLNASGPVRPCRWMTSGLSATFAMSPDSSLHTVSIEIDAMHKGQSIYLRIRTNIASQGLAAQDYGKFAAHVSGVGALVVTCQTICAAAGFAEPA